MAGALCQRERPFDYLHSLKLHNLPRDDAIAAAAEAANIALYQYSDGVSEDAREPYNGSVTIDGDLLRVRFGRVPRTNPDDGDLAPELEPIPIDDILIQRLARHALGGPQRGQRRRP